MANLDFKSDDYIADTLSMPIALPQSLYAIQQAALLRLITQRGTYWADPLLGSRLYLLKREKDVGRVMLLAKQYALEALEPMQIQQRITSVTVTVTKIKTSFLQLSIEMITRQQQKLTMNHFVAVGG